MRFRVVVLSQVSVRVGAGCVEISQAGRTHAVDLVGPVQNALDHELGLAVRAARVDLGVLVDRHPVRHAEKICGGRQDELAHTVLGRRLHQIQRIDDVVVEVQVRIAHRLADQGVRCEVQDGVEPEGAEQACEGRMAGKVAFD